MTKEEAVKIGWRREIFEDKKLMRRFLTQAKGKLRLMYPKVIFIGKMPRYVNCRKKWNIREIRFYNKMGVLIKRVKNVKGFITYSTNGKYILISHPYDDYNPEGYGGILYDWNGNIIWQKNKGCFECVSDGGYVMQGFVSVTGFGIPFKIYNLQGKEIKEIKLPEWKIWDAGVFSTGKYFVISYRGKGGFDTTGITLLSEEGEIIFNTKIPGDIATLGRWCYILPSKEMIIGARKRIIFISNNGKLEKIIRVSFPISMPFFQYSMSKKEIYIYSGDVLYKIDKTKKIFVSLVKRNLKLWRKIFWEIKNESLKGYVKRGSYD